MENGKFVISLDFEIYWGIRDVVKLKDYKEELEGVQKVIPLLLGMFEKYKINATFATVGLLFFSTKKELLNNLPIKKPQYSNLKLSPYHDIVETVGTDENCDHFHLAGSLIKRIKTAGQEIGSHSFSHYYCLEKGQSTEDFKEDILSAKLIAAKNGIELKSFVFPRNQYNRKYLEICKNSGFTCFRGNEKSKLFSSETYGRMTILRRPFRLLDSYFNLSGHNCFSSDETFEEILINIPSSRFLRPYSKSLDWFEKIRLKRITDSMTHAARNHLAYHLWWHPHNFGKNISKNFSFLERILIHYHTLKKDYNFESINMSDFSKEVSLKKNT